MNAKLLLKWSVPLLFVAAVAVAAAWIVAPTGDLEAWATEPADTVVAPDMAASPMAALVAGDVVGKPAPFAFRTSRSRSQFIP